MLSMQTYWTFVEPWTRVKNEVIWAFVIAWLSTWELKNHFRLSSLQKQAKINA